MVSEVVITTGARLHFGPLSYAPQSGRHFGGVGVMIDSPGFQLRTTRATHDEIIGPEATASRVRRFVEQTRGHWEFPPCRIEIRSEVPPHLGLGSGTQLGMAVAQSLAVMAGQHRWGIPFLARMVGRGEHSAIGCWGFERGGILVDGGKRNSESLGALVAADEFPGDWRFLLVTPPVAAGLSDTAERAAFARLEPMPSLTTDRLCRIVLMELLPALHDYDFDACSHALYEYGRLVGEYFSAVQGGVYAEPLMRALVMFLRELGCVGVGQTSWGPTIFVLCRERSAAETLRDRLGQDQRWSRCAFRIAAPLNDGAKIEERR